MCCWNGGWVYDYPTGESLFQSGAAFNFSNYLDVHADELIDRSATSDDLDALYDYQEYIAEQVPGAVHAEHAVTAVRGRRRACAASRRSTRTGMINPENWYYVEEAS